MANDSRKMRKLRHGRKYRGEVEPNSSVSTLFPSYRIPREIFERILSYVPFKDRLVNCSRVTKTWRNCLLSTYMDSTRSLSVMDLPFNQNSFVKTPRRVKALVISHSAISAALRCLLPKLGSELECLSFDRWDRFYQLADSHFELITRYCPKLKNLRFGQISKDNQMADRVDPGRLTSQLSRLRQLRSVKLTSYLCEDHLCDKSIHDFASEIAYLSAIWPLKSLTLADFQVPIPIGARNLAHLEISNSRITDFHLEQICHLSPNLVVLRLFHCSPVTNLSPIATLRDLESLWLSCRLTDSQLDIICRNCKKIRNLNVETSRGFTSFSWLQQMINLEELEVSQDQLTDEAVGSLPKDLMLETMEDLWISSRLDEDLLTDIGLISFTKKCPHLKILHIGVHGITDAFVREVLSNCKQLREISFEISGITDSSIPELGINGNLRVLNIRRCDGVTVEGFWLLHIRRVRDGIIAPLRIGIEKDHQIWQSILTKNGDLSKVNVHLAELPD